MKDGEWDIRCPQEMADLFPERKGYYYMIDRSMAKKVCITLSRAYAIEVPNITVSSISSYGRYDDKTRTFT